VSQVASSSESAQSAGSESANQDHLAAKVAVAVFLAFALSYFFSAVLRAVTATMAPILTQEFKLSSGDLGLLAGGYFLGFAAMQLPLGKWLDRYGPKRVLLGFLSVAVIGCGVLALASSFTTLLLGRILTGVGVCACLMAPLTAYRRWFAPELQLRANSWMLMSGSLGMVASTLPVQALLGSLGWRGIFVLVAGLILLVMGVIASIVPRWQTTGPPSEPNASISYRAIFAHPYFRRMAIFGVFNYGGMVAIQSLWAAPWMMHVAGHTSLQAASGLFKVNLCMLTAFLLWGWINPKLSARGYSADWLMLRGAPLSILALLTAIALGPQAHWWAWAAFCVLSTFGSLSQPAVGMAFPVHQVGRALSAFNLLIFGGVFIVQWGIGLAVDGFLALGLTKIQAYQGAMSLYALTCIWGYTAFAMSKAVAQPGGSLEAANDNLKP
jgi:predicted MFS family arabinose efflux permease